MKSFCNSICNFLFNNLENILYIFQWILVFGFIFLSIVLILLVLLQRGEEGAFSKNRGDKITTSDKTMMRSTILVAIILFSIAIILNGFVHYQKHKTHKQYNIVQETTSLVK